MPNKPRGVPRVDDRRVISGIVHVPQSGCRWNGAPVISGPPRRSTAAMFDWASGDVCVRCSRGGNRSVAPPRC